jgi:hypothetical protein
VQTRKVLVDDNDDTENSDDESSDDESSDDEGDETSRLYQVTHPTYIYSFRTYRSTDMPH